METQRVNVYIAGSGITVFYIEQYNPTLKQWFNVGDTYEKIEHAATIVERHNLENIMNEILNLKGIK